MIHINRQISYIRELSLSHVTCLYTRSPFYPTKGSYSCLDVISKMFFKYRFITANRNCNHAIFPRFTRSDYIQLITCTLNYSRFCFIKIHFDFTYISAKILTTNDHLSRNPSLFRVIIR